MINEYLVELLDAGLTPRQMKLVRMAMANYALAALMDSEIAEEAANICQEQEDEQ